MRIKLAILEKDINYLNRMSAAFSTKYSDKFEIYSFTEEDMALTALESLRIDVLIAGDIFDIDVTKLPKRCGFAYLVDSLDISSCKGQSAICKFQKADMIYKQILSIYSEIMGNISGLRLTDDSCKVVAFTSPSGGSGSSSMAAACAVHMSMKGKKPLYLNIEKFGASDSFFSADGQFDMSDLIFALKSKKTNLSMKMEGCVKQDSKGVYFYSQPKIALDMLELNSEDIVRLIMSAKLSGLYSHIIVDMDFGIDEETIKILNEAYSIVWTGDGSEISNSKIVRAYQALAVKEQTADNHILERIVIGYNKFSNKSGKTAGLEGVKEIGGAPRYEHATTEQIVNQLSQMQMFDKID